MYVTNVKQIDEQKKSLNIFGKESTNMHGFEISSCIVCLLSVFLFKRRYEVNYADRAELDQVWQIGRFAPLIHF